MADCGGLAWRMSTSFFLANYRGLCVVPKQVAEAFSLLPTYPSGSSSHLCHDCPLLLRETEPTQGYGLSGI